MAEFRAQAKDIKGLILAGGSGSRLHPVTKVINKHLLPVGRKPMIYHPVSRLVEAGVHDIMVVSNAEHMGGILKLLGSGREFGCRFTYAVQDEAGGIAEAVGLAKNFVGPHALAVALGDNIFQQTLAPVVDRFREQGTGARVVLKEVSDPQRFGVATLQGNRIVEIEEKPLTPKSHYAVTGFYLYDANVFSIIKTLQPSARGELEITDVNRRYAAEGKLQFDILDGWWSDAGTFESLALVNRYLNADKSEERTSCS